MREGEREMEDERGREKERERDVESGPWNKSEESGLLLLELTFSFLRNS